MGFLSVILAAAASYGFGAVWYMKLAKPWMQAAEITEAQIKGENGKQDPTPFIIAAICSILVAGMMRHMFAMADIHTAGKGLISGLGIGIFMVTPWIVTNYAYAMRPRNLTLIDGGYATIGCMIMGLVLGLIG